MPISRPSRSGALGELERAVMERVWAAPTTISVRDVHTGLAERDLAYTTVMTVLDRLAKKGLVLRTREGRAWLYRAAHTREELAAELMDTALGTAEDRSAALVAFVDRVSPEEAAALRAALDGLPADPAGRSAT